MIQELCKPEIATVNGGSDVKDYYYGVLIAAAVHEIPYSLWCGDSLKDTIEYFLIKAVPALIGAGIVHAVKRIFCGRL